MHHYSTLDRRQFVRVCECGCGQPTLLAWGNKPKWGQRHMQPCRFLHGHATRETHRPNEVRIGGVVAHIHLGVDARGGRIEALVDLVDLPRILAQARWRAQWSPKTQTYYVTGRRGLYLHRFILDAPRGFVVDHKNHDTLDCRRENLRLCTYSQNSQNRRGAAKSSKTGIRDVSWDKRHRRWRVQIGTSVDRYTWIGRFDDLEAAEAAAIEARRRLLTHAEN